jgi:hypothetical protein
MNRYRVLLPLTVHTADAAYSQGDEFDHDFTEDEENANVASGLLEILPQTYEVIGPSRVHDTAPGGRFDRALRVGEEALLVAGGHIRRVEPEAPAAKPTKQKTKEVND